MIGWLSWQSIPIFIGRVLGSPDKKIGTASSPKESLTGFLFLFYAVTYIIFSQKLNKYYVGACTDLERRLYEHNIGHSKFTSTGLPWVLKYKEYYETLQQAKNREAAIKKMKSRIYLERLIG